ncbi:Protein of unknown function [Pyronema omphalodes CBS 100304]|uniref:Uncharacterized protein n=1 Tax=Pyronema omphalodes (strain CBS 100304) TaxID=1076935 RepID=U4KTV8_PYROM|nr:Protein of unknown function [Pyronema omphalodes CBS 100304]
MLYRSPFGTLLIHPKGLNPSGATSMITS